MANMLFANNCNTTLNGGITAVATSMVVTTATGFPVPTGSQYFYCTLADAATQTTIEIVKVTAVSGTTFTIVRGQDGTSGTVFASGAIVSLRLVRASLNDFPKLDETNTFTQLQTINTIGVSGSTSTTPVLSFNASNCPIASGTSISGSYLQFVLQNTSGTAGASTNYVLSNDLGTDSTYYGEFGMNSSVYSSGTPADFFSINNGIYFSGHDGDITLGSGNGKKLYLAWGTSGQSAHVINASGAIGLNTNLASGTGSGTTNFGTAGQVLTSQGSSSTPTWTTTGTGTVTSVAATVPAFLSIAGSPITTSGTLAISYSGTALPVANGGTGLTSLTSGYVPYGNGTGAFSSHSGLQYNGAGSLAVGGSFTNTVTNGIAINNATAGNYPGIEIQTAGVTRFFINATAGASYITSVGTNPMVFYTNGVEAGRFDSSQNFLIGCTTNPSTSVSGKLINSSYFQSSSGAATTAYTHFYFTNGNGNVGTIVTSGSLTSYNVSSDRRLKENIVPLKNGLEIVNSLKPSQFNYIADPTVVIDGFIADELQSVLPLAVTGETNAVDENGNPVYQGVDSSFLIPHLVAALQELNNKFDAYVASHP